MIRTTITLPEDLYEELRRAAFYQKKTISAIIRERINGKPKKEKQKSKSALEALIGLAELSKGKKTYKFNRKKFYGDIIKHKLSFGY